MRRSPWIPLPIALLCCPDCAARLWVNVETMEVECETEPDDVMTEEWEEYDRTHRHWQSDWQPVLDKARGIARRYAARKPPSAPPGQGS
jgi:uncharacterized protein YbaR (Trm112 family)